MGVKAWITVNGNHIPIMDGESKASAVGRFIKDKRNKSNERRAYGEDWKSGKQTIRGRLETASEHHNKSAKEFENYANEAKKQGDMHKYEILKQTSEDYRRRAERTKSVYKLNTKGLSKATDIPDSARTGKTSKERRAAVGKYFYNQPKGTVMKIEGKRYTKVDDAPYGMWKGAGDSWVSSSFYAEDLVKRYAHTRKK